MKKLVIVASTVVIADTALRIVPSVASAASERIIVNGGVINAIPGLIESAIGVVGAAGGAQTIVAPVARNIALVTLAGVAMKSQFSSKFEKAA